MKIRHFGSQCQPDRAALPTHARAAPRHVLVCKLVEVDGRCNICGRCEPGCEHTVEIPAAKFTIACLNTSQYTAAAAKQLPPRRPPRTFLRTGDIYPNRRFRSIRSEHESRLYLHTSGKQPRKSYEKPCITRAQFHDLPVHGSRFRSSHWSISRLHTPGL